MTAYDIWSAAELPEPVAGAEPVRPQLTAYPLDGAGPHPAVLVLPGGGYAHTAPIESEPVARWLNSLGIAAFVLDYRVHPDLHPAPLLDAQRAIRWVRHHAGHWRVDPGRVGVLGFSAGGHLAGSLAVGMQPGGLTGAPDLIDTAPVRPELAVLCYPVISMHTGSVRNLLGPDATDADRAAVRIDSLIDADTPPTFLWHTADDAGVDVANSLDAARALRLAGVDFELHVFPHGQHGLSIADGDPVVSQWTSLAAVWLRTHGF